VGKAEVAPAKAADVGLVGIDLRAKRYGAKGFLFYFAIYSRFNFFGPSPDFSNILLRLGCFKGGWVTAITFFGETGV